MKIPMLILLLSLTGCAPSLDARIREIRTMQAERQKEIEELKVRVQRMQQTCSEAR